jgi:hypothetical protein
MIGLSKQGQLEAGKTIVEEASGKRQLRKFLLKEMDLDLAFRTAKLV